MRFLDGKFIKFLLVGVLNTVVGAGIMFILYNVFHCSYWISSVFNYICGGILSYFLNKYFTFQNRKKSARQVLFFVINLAVCYLIAYIGAKNLMMFILKNQSVKIQENCAMLAGMCIYTLLNYFGQRLVVFKNKNDEKNPETKNPGDEK